MKCKCVIFPNHRQGQRWRGTMHTPITCWVGLQEEADSQLLEAPGRHSCSCCLWVNLASGRCYGDQIYQHQVDLSSMAFTGSSWQPNQLEARGGEGGRRVGCFHSPSSFPADDQKLTVTINSSGTRSSYPKPSLSIPICSGPILRLGLTP